MGGEVRFDTKLTAVVWKIMNIVNEILSFRQKDLVMA